MYRILAKFYDDLQDNDYNAFVSYYQSVFKRFGLEPKLILDMGCGTGNITVPMAEKGYDMIGLDCSEEMLEIAAEKARTAGHDILFLQQDMTDFELYGTVDAMVCALDCNVIHAVRCRCLCLCIPDRISNAVCGLCITILIHGHYIYVC